MIHNATFLCFSSFDHSRKISSKLPRKNQPASSTSLRNISVSSRLKISPLATCLPGKSVSQNLTLKTSLLSLVENISPPKRAPLRDQTPFFFSLFSGPPVPIFTRKLISTSLFPRSASLESQPPLWL